MYLAIVVDRHCSQVIDRGQVAAVYTLSWPCRVHWDASTFPEAVHLSEYTPARGVLVSAVELMEASIGQLIT